MQSNTEQPLAINSPLVEEALQVLQALKHPLRQQMLQIMYRHGRIHVTQLYIELRLEQSIASQQLARMRKTGLVLTERRGKHIYYSVNYAYLRQLEALCGEIVAGQHGVQEESRLLELER